MPKTLLILAALVSPATAAAAQDGAQVSVGYAFVKYLETDGDNTPAGAYLSVSGGGRTTLELDAAYHRESEEGFSLDTLTLLAGPKFSPPSRGKADPYVHLLGGVRHDRARLTFFDEEIDDSNTALGGMAGVGVDIRASEKIGIRLGADFQLFRDEGENLKSLRLNAGLTF